MLAEPDNHLTDEDHPEQRMNGCYCHGGAYWGICGAGRLEIVGQVDGGAEKEGHTHQSGYCASDATRYPFATRRYCTGEQSRWEEQRRCV